MKAARLVREIIERYQGGEPVLLDDMLRLERAVIHLEGRYEGSIITVPQNIEEVGTYTAGKLEATEKHLNDMRRLVMLENEKGEVD